MHIEEQKELPIGDDIEDAIGKFKYLLNAVENVINDLKDIDNLCYEIKNSYGSLLKEVTDESYNVLDESNTAVATAVDTVDYVYRIIKKFITLIDGIYKDYYNRYY